MATNFKQVIQALLEPAGVVINGPKDWHIQVRDERFYEKALRGGKRALAETYADGWWDTRDTMALHVLFEKILQAGVDKDAARHLSPWVKLSLVRVHLFDSLAGISFLKLFFDRQSISKSRRVGKKHYDLGNKFYELTFGDPMIYSCARFDGLEGPKDLSRAQLHKLETSFQKIHPWPGMRLVEVGCGWGDSLKFAFEQYGAHGVGVTISHEQAVLARERCAELPIEIIEQDYRDLVGEFDAAVSFGMAEHVGLKNHEGLYRIIADCLVPGGRYLHHEIGKPNSAFTFDQYIEEKVFPGGELLSLAQMIKPSEGIFKVENIENIGLNYHPTLLCWDERHMRYWDKIRVLENGRYDERFKRERHYFYNYCASAFLTGHLHVYQIVFQKPHGLQKQIR